MNYSAEYTPAGFRKRSDGVVEIRGMVKNGSAVNATIFTLPEGYRPKHRLLLANISNQLVGRIDILANGQVQQQVGSTAWLSLDGITFYAEQ